MKIKGADDIGYGSFSIKERLAALKGIKEGLEIELSCRKEVSDRNRRIFWK